MFNFTSFNTLLVLISLVTAKNGILNQKYHPPKVEFKLPLTKEQQARIATEINQLPDDEEGQSPWELSGLFEGDILVDPNDNAGIRMRNGLRKADTSWPLGIVPYYITENEFSDRQKLTILLAMDEFQQRTCIRFWPYKDTDQHWVVFRANGSGCWSKTGMMTKGQPVNLQTPNCVKHGTVIHELLHTLGFVHQHNAPNRDRFVRILWDNILKKKQHNFQRRLEEEISDYGAEYDYGSVMHYGRRTFSKNDAPTIEPLDPNANIGQRKGLSAMDIAKLERMYEKQCSDRNDAGTSWEFLEQLVAASDAEGKKATNGGRFVNWG